MTMALENQNSIDAILLLQRCKAARSNRLNNTFSLLRAVERNAAKQHEASIKSVAGLLNESAPHINRIAGDRLRGAANFNVFSALGIVRKEVIQSRFLAYLLSPKERHNQGSKFLGALLEKAGIFITNMGHARVDAERSAGEYLGRMDIVIDCKPWIIVIEVKIDAGEGEDQLARYRKWLERERGYDEDKKRLIFLTPTGHESVTGMIGAYQQLSFSNLAEAFAPLLLGNDIPQLSVREVLEQYVSICRLIGGEDMAAQDKEFQELLSKPENLRVALEIEKQASFARRDIAKQFSENVQKIIQSRIDETSPIKDSWRSTLYINGDGTSDIWIRTVRHKITANFAVRAEHVFTTSDKGWVGWYRPAWADLKVPQETASITEKMLIDGCSGGAEGWWVASDYLRNGKRGYILSDNEDILACAEDNRTQDHPLALALADEIWQMFTSYRQDIEALPTFQQMTS